MDPLAKAQELHTKLHNQLLAKDKLLAASEAKSRELASQLAHAQKAVTDEKRRSEAELEERDAQLAERIAELEAREEALEQGQTELNQLRVEVDAERAAARTSVAEMEATLREIETANLELTRERDATRTANAASIHHYHEQLISLSKNHLEQTNEDIQRIASLRAEAETQKKDIATRFSEQLIAAARTEADLRDQLASLRARAEEDAARWSTQKAELEAIVEANAAELATTLKRVKESSKSEIALLTERVASDATLLNSLQAWDATRATKESEWQQARDDAKLLRTEVDKSRARYEKLEAASNAALHSLRRECEDAKAKLAETEATLAKKSQALQVYHKEIKENQSKLQEIKRLQAAQEKVHREQQDKAAAQIAALGGPDRRAGAKGASSSGFGDVFSGLFKSSAEKEREKAAAAAAAQQAAAARRTSVSVSDESDGPKRSLSGADEESLNSLHEEMAVSLSKRVESLEDDKLTLTGALDATKKKLAQAELLNQLQAEKIAAFEASSGSSSSSSRKRDSTIPASSSSSSLSAEDAATSTPSRERKSGVFGGLLGSKKDKSGAGGDLFSDPARVKTLLEEQVRENQHLTADAEKNAHELKQMKHLLETAKADLAEATRKVKLSDASKKGKTRGVAAAAAAAASTTNSSPDRVASPDDSINNTAYSSTTDTTS